jgi:hypothetical protein
MQQNRLVVIVETEAEMSLAYIFAATLSNSQLSKMSPLIKIEASYPK